MSLSPHETVSRARDGDPQAFTTLVEQYRGAIFTIALSFSRDRDTADDIAQETFVLAFQHLTQLRDPSRFAPWLYGIARRVGLGARKRDVRAVPLEDATEQVSPEPDPAATVALRATLDGTLQCLSHETRLTTLLFYRDSLSHKEIAALLQIPETTVKSRLRNARLRLKQEWITLMTLPQTSTDFTSRLVARAIARSEIRALALSPDGRVLATAGATDVTETTFESRVQLWDAESGALLWTLPVSSWTRSLAFDPSGRRVVFSSGLPGRRDAREGQVVFVDSKTGHVETTIPLDFGPSTLALSPDGRHIALGKTEEYSDYRSSGVRGAVVVLDTDTGERRWHLAPHFNQIGALAFSPDGKTLAGTGLLRNADPEAEDLWLGSDVRLWSMDSGECRARFERHGARGITHNLAFFPDGDAVACPSGDGGSVEIFSLSPQGAPPISLPVDGARLFSVAVSPNGRSLAAGAGDGTVTVFDVTSQQKIGALSCESAPIDSLVFASETRLIGGDRRGQLRWWDVG